MTKEKQKERRVRVRSMNQVLARMYPHPEVALNHGTTWEFLVAVILSAQCTDERVNKITPALFKKYKTVKAYRDAPRGEFEHMIFSCGFYRAKTKSIQGAAEAVLSRFHGEVPHTMAELLTLPGVARKTANVILGSAFGIHEGIAVDTHVRRFAIRYDLTDHTDPIRIERDLMTIMPKKEWWYFNHRLVHYGREVCPARKHNCKEHPLTLVYPKANMVWPKAH